MTRLVTILYAKQQAEDAKMMNLLEKFNMNVGQQSPQIENKFQAFQGHGQSLLSSSQPEASIVTATTTMAVYELKIDDSQPITSLQIRLHNGERLVVKFNHTHTVQDIRLYIEAYVSPSVYSHFV